ncbi:MAG: ABC transporter substrate-binding protein [Anaerolineae bacterium]
MLKNRNIFAFLVLLLTMLFVVACSPAGTGTEVVEEEVPAEDDMAEDDMAEDEEMADDEEMAEEPYKIGFIAAITGGAAPLGEPEAATAEMIQAQLDEQGGITGPDGVTRPVEIIILDSQSNPDAATSAITQLIEEEEVDLLIAGTTSGNSLAMVPIATENQVPMISMAAAGAIVRNEDGSAREWIFKTPQDNLQSAEWQGQYLNTLGFANACYLFENNGYGQDTLASAQAVYPDYGVEIGYNDSFNATDTEFPQVQNVLADGCEVVVIGSTTNGSINMHNAVAQGAPDVAIVHGHGVCNQAFIDGLTDNKEGTPLPCGKLLVPDQLPDDDPQKDVVTTYIDEYTAFTGGDPISTFGGHAYDAFLMAIAALESLEGGQELDARRAAIRDYLETQIIDFPGTGGVFNMSAEDHLGLDFTALTFVRVEGDGYAFYPEDAWGTE